MSPFGDTISSHIMATNLKEAIEFLVAGGYLVPGKNGKLLVMQQKIAADLKKPQVFDVVKIDQQIAVVQKTDWVEKYKQFIADAKVPTRCESRHGEFYDTNKYSEDGMKAFRKAIESGIVYDVLIRSTFLYYHNGVRLKVAIGRYMKDGLWRSDYDRVIESSESGTLEQHIKSELDDGQHTFTQLG
jgi:hypothetical protein